MPLTGYSPTTSAAKSRPRGQWQKQPGAGGGAGSGKPRSGKDSTKGSAQSAGANQSTAGGVQALRGGVDRRVRPATKSDGARNNMAPGNPSDVPRGTLDDHSQLRDQLNNAPNGNSRGLEDDALSSRRRNQYVSDPPGVPTNRTNTVSLQPQSTRQVLQLEKEIMDSGEDLKVWKERKMEERLQREHEQRRDLRMLQEYAPWGKPGCGAPNAYYEGGATSSGSASMCRSNLQDENSSGMTLHMGSRFGGGGEVSRTDTGEARTRLPAHPEVRFQDNAVNSSCRSPRATVDLPQSTGRFHRADRLPTVDEQTEAFFTFGRPGCGAPLKTDSGHVRATLPTAEMDKDQREHVERRRREAQKYREQLDLQAGQNKDRSTTTTSARSATEGYDPWGKGAGNMPRDSAGFTRPPPKLRDPTDTALTTDNISTVADALKRQMSESAQGSANRYATDSADDVLAQQERHIYLQSLRTSAERERIERQQREPSLTSSAAGEHTTADWMTSLQVGRPRRDPRTDKLITSDRKGLKDLFASGSEAPLSPRRRNQSDKEDLHSHLSEQAENRQRQKEESRVREREETEKHLETVDGMFGRPGCGAPMRDERGKVQAGRLRSNELAVEGYKSDTTAVRL